MESGFSPLFSKPPPHSVSVGHRTEKVNSLLSTINRTRPRISKDIEKLNNTITTDFTEHTTQKKQNRYFSSNHRTYTKIDCALNCKTNLKYERTEIIHRIFSNDNEIKLEISNRKITENFLNTQKLNNTFLNNP